MDEHDIFSIEREDKPKKGMSTEKKYLIAISVIAVVLVVAMTMVGVYIGYVSARKNDTTVLEVNPSINITATEDKRVGVQDVVSEVENSVVQVTSESTTAMTVSRGSGVIISKDGYIITNAHVVDNAETSSNIKIALANGKMYTARKFAKDNITDIAIVKIDTTETLVPAKLGLDTELKKGEHVVVIGNPLGTLGGSVTDGILSALGRDIIVENRPMKLLQTNAEINPGNSGGGMFNMRGELIGIVNAKNSATEVEGIGFAIPVKTAYDSAVDLIQYGYVKGRIDTGIIPVGIHNFFDFINYFDPRVVAYDGTPGVYVYKTATKTFEYGDKIIAIDNKVVGDLTTYNALLDTYKIGDSVVFTVIRNGTKIDISVTLKEYTGKTQ